MSFWSKFGKVMGVVGAGAATLGTMGAASPALAGALGGIGMGGKVLSGIGKVAGAANALSPVLGGMAKGRAEGRQAETTNLLNRDQLNLSRDQMVNQAIQQEFANRLGLANQEASMLDLRANQARRGDLQANVQDVHIPDSANGRIRVQHWSGGIRPSALGPNAREAGRRLSDTALAKMGNEGLPAAPGAGHYSAVSPLPQSGFLDKLLGGAGAATSLLGTFPQQGGGRNLGTNPPAGAPVLNVADQALARLNMPKLLTPEQLRAQQQQGPQIPQDDEWDQIG